jgi:long-subunit acyl-CoA synthetase (AMP-forming)
MNEFIERFIDVSEKHPHNIAISVNGERTISYRSLAQKASNLSDLLKEQNFSQGKLAAIEIEKSPEYLVSMLAIWMAGGVFVPLDPKLPKARRDVILKSSKPAIIISSDYNIQECSHVHEYAHELA